MKIKLTHAEVRTLRSVRKYPKKDLSTGVRDSKGRMIGAVAHRGDSITPAGVMVYTAAVDNTRGGFQHGAGTEFQRFDNAKERDAYIEKRFDEILKKYPQT